MVAPVSIRASMTTPLILTGTCTSPSARRPARVANPAGAGPEGGMTNSGRLMRYALSLFDSPSGGISGVLR